MKNFTKPPFGPHVQGAVIKDVLLGIIPIRLEYFKLIAEHIAIQTLKGAGSSHKQQVLPVYRGGKG